MSTVQSPVGYANKSFVPNERQVIVEAAVRTVLAAWRGHKSFAWAGECGIFADYVYHESKRHGVEPLIDAFDNKQNAFSPVKMPPGTSYEELDKLDAFKGLNHVWLVCDGRHYDASVPEGVDDPSELHSFRLGLVYRLQQVAPEALARLCAAEAWWREASALTVEFDKVHQERDAFYEEN